MMNIHSSDIFEEFYEKGVLDDFNGKNILIQQVAPVESSKPGDLVFADREEFLDTILQNRPSGVVTSKPLAEKLSDLKETAVFTTGNVGVAHALIRQRYADRDLFDTEWDRIHPSAVIHPTAKVDATALVGPRVVIGKECVIEKRCVIMAGSVVEYGSTIGEDTTIHPSVVVGYGTRIGKRVIVKSGTVIGSEGFGFARDHKNKSHRIPQVGHVVIHDDVVIGANNCIDRAAYDATVIGRGTKLDNLCHIAHNVKIGEDCLLTAGLVVAGSTVIGDRVITSGQTGILDHLNIADDTVFVHRAGVIENITEPGIYAGLPTQPLPEYLRNTAVLKKIVSMRKTLNALEKRLGELESP